jgi:hypothetical protein
MRRSNFALRLEPSLLAGARKLAEAQGVSLNTLISIAVAEKLSALPAEDGDDYGDSLLNDPHKKTDPGAQSFSKLSP